VGANWKAVLKVPEPSDRAKAANRTAFARQITRTVLQQKSKVDFESVGAHL